MKKLSIGRTEKPWEDLVVRPEPKPAADKRDQQEIAASYLTHELRAPLTSVFSALSLLSEQSRPKLDKQERAILDMAVKNTERLAGLINDVMDYSKIRAGKMELHRAACSSNGLIQEAVFTLKAWSITKGVRLVRVMPEEPLARVNADPLRIIQVLTNLISNSIKFTPIGGRIEVSAKLGRHEHKGMIVFTVKDSGCGIPPEDADRVFACFEQSAATGKKASHGTGLGLSLARSMVNLHGGEIWMESWPGLGSTFRFSLPICPQDQIRAPKAESKPLEYHGLLVDAFRRVNAFLAFFS